MSAQVNTDNHTTEIANENVERKETRQKRWYHFPTRYTVVLLNLFAVNLSIIFSGILNVAIVKMVKSSGKENNAEPNNISKQSGEFDWSQQLQGTILTAFLIGYGFGCLTGGRLGEVFGPKRTIGASICVVSILSLLTPLAASISVYLLFFLRLVMGVCSGMIMPVMSTVISRWMPVSERSSGIGLIYGAVFIGEVIGSLTTGMLCQSSLLNGWPLPFYVFGGLGLLWNVACFYLMYDSPTEHPSISLEETEYILANQENEISIKAPKIPYRAIFTSVPVWAAIFANIGEAWGNSTLGVNLPLYLANNLHFDAGMVGLLAAIPAVFQGFTMWFSGYLADILIHKRNINTTLVRRSMNSFGQLTAGLFLVLITLVGPNRETKVALLTTALFVNGFISAGFKSAIVDMSPRFSGSISGFTMFFGFFVSFISPYVVGYVTSHNESTYAWNIVFWITAGFFTMGGLSFLLFGSSESQPWTLGEMAEEGEERARNRTELKTT